MRNRIIAIVVIGMIAGLFFGLGGYGWLAEDGRIERLLTETGALGPIIFIAVMWSTQPLGVPGIVYMAPAGVVWPNGLAIILCWIGNMGASYLAFVFARWFARDWVTRRIPPRMHRFDDRLSNGGLMPVVLLRIVFGQLPPADWLLGVTRVRQRTFLVGTGIGIIPGVILFVVAGGGLFEWLMDLDPATRWTAIATITAALVVARSWNRRRRRAARLSVQPAAKTPTL